MREAGTMRAQSKTLTGRHGAEARSAAALVPRARMSTIMLCLAIVAGGSISSHALAGEAKAESAGMTLAAAHALAGSGAMDMVELPTIHNVDPGACTTLVLDRQSNQTVERPCPRDGLALRLDEGDTREDLAVASGVR